MVGAIMVDFRKAFDLVDHEILLKKLQLYKCSKWSLIWFESYLTNRTQVVNLNGTCSSSSVVKCGVPQGSLLGPLLFLLFINDLPLTLSQIIGSTDMYADDTTICEIGRSRDIIEKNLQSALLVLEQWCTLNGMVLNTSKTKVLYITTPHKRTRIGNDPLNLHYKNALLELTTGDKILGLHVNANLKWDDHISNIKKKLSSNVWLLSRIKSFVPFDSRVLFYKAYIQPHIDYCNIVWGGASIHKTDGILKLQKRACKVILGEQYTTFDNAMATINSLTVHQRILLNKAKFMYKVHNNQIPSYISDTFSYRENSYVHLRFRNDKTDFHIPRPRLEMFKQSMLYSGPKIWNGIPVSIRNSSTLHNFAHKFIDWMKGNTIS